MPSFLLLLPLASLLGDPEAGREPAMAVARDTIRARLGVDESRVHVVDAVAARWPDASLGCPEKGRVYAQVVTEGYRVRVRVEDRTFDVRVAGRSAIVCGLGTATPGAEADAAAAVRLYRSARRDLAVRLNVPEKDVRVDFVRPETWPDGPPACLASPSPDRATPTRGFVIQLAAGGRTYTYMSDMENVRPCDSSKP